MFTSMIIPKRFNFHLQNAEVGMHQTSESLAMNVLQGHLATNVERFVIVLISKGMHIINVLYDCLTRMITKCWFVL